MTTEEANILSDLQNVARKMATCPPRRSAFTDPERARYYIHLATQGLYFIGSTADSETAKTALWDANHHIYQAIALLDTSHEMKVEIDQEDDGEIDLDPDEPFDRSHNVE